MNPGLGHVLEVDPAGPTWALAYDGSALERPAMIETRIPCLLLAAAAAAWTAAPAAAVDGVLEIHPACVAAGCFPGDDPGLPVTIAAPGGYRLTGDLTVPDAGTNAIVITAGHVSLDLNGFSLRGVTECTFEPGPPVSVTCAPTGGGNGIVVLGRDVEVFGGGISGMGNHGVIAVGGESRIHDLAATDNGDDGVQSGVGSLVWNVVAAENGGDGFVNPGVLRDSQSLRNGGNGLLAQAQSFPCLVTGSLFHQNVAAGIAVARATVRGNLVTDNGGAGLVSAAGAGYSENNFSGNNGGGAQVSGVTLAVGPNGCNGGLCP